ncbi:endonuclease/exonuclease/phosphatase family protein [Toxoplasma gondii RUB]|uniref:Endonuclease/exonuclease/phosphatase family protein n=8 Tax=Toxoplasma gondii TaxID=5811 RepID=S7W971_TOXGG|nr:endonuclease/exonuclease/phosphatase family protein [Toxoplasma gondii GT1]KAF4638679.1 endonuclease/exonuclease/phosphatase family protein [Toxoplasma gondii]KFG46404.1 endonuclease/exonuclease/phosphatase family protein [Toxoplasma gondii GAB2-2007-GAL-DOM2]KFG54172.1 endonuclease/exonuclease/phosphatase family protein [Toxoplasma gondii FOU]KFG64334.1 endonuclease/exonuclease/phosphatase family protein [Toxoplasma gondii RUB]KFH15936.1 endonuclease/exonuclease/phosphatase family protein 
MATPLTSGGQVQLARQQVTPVRRTAPAKLTRTRDGTPDPSKRAVTTKGEDVGSDPVTTVPQSPRQDRMPPLMTRGSTYVNVSLNSAADELTLVSFNIQMLVDCCSLSVNWWSRERELLPYLRKVSESYRPDVMIFQECWAEEVWRLLKTLEQDKDCPFPYQTRILGSDSGPPCACPDCGDCCCTCCQCCVCLRCPCLCCCPCGCCLPPAAKLMGKEQERKREGVAEAANTADSSKPNVSASESASRRHRDSWTSVSGNYQGARRNGGVAIISKWPILERHAYIYYRGALPDCLENKGAILARIEKAGKIYNVVGTHLQSGNSNNKIRVAQLKELAAWLRSGMEECEQTEFASEEAEEPKDNAEKREDKTSKRQDKKQRRKSKRKDMTTGGAGCCRWKGGGLPKGLVKATEPLIIAGDLNLRYKEDHKYLMEAIRPDNLNCSLCLADPEDSPSSYDTELNDTCYYNNGKPKLPIKQLIDYFLLSNDHFGSVSRYQQTITLPADNPMLFRFFACLCIPLGSTKVHHVSDHLPVCVTIRHSKEA